MGGQGRHSKLQRFICRCAIVEYVASVKVEERNARVCAWLREARGTGQCLSCPQEERVRQWRRRRRRRLRRPTSSSPRQRVCVHYTTSKGGKGFQQDAGHASRFAVCVYAFPAPASTVSVRYTRQHTHAFYAPISIKLASPSSTGGYRRRCSCRSRLVTTDGRSNHFARYVIGAQGVPDRETRSFNLARVAMTRRHLCVSRIYLISLFIQNIYKKNWNSNSREVEVSLPLFPGGMKITFSWH